MGMARSSYYATPAERAEDPTLAEVREIAEAFSAYGYRRIGAELRHRGHVVNSKRIRRLMKENALNPWRRPRFARTTDSDHHGPIFPFVAKDFEVHEPDQLWGEPLSAIGPRTMASDITYVAIAADFVYVAVVLDAWSREGWWATPSPAGSTPG